MRSVSPKNLARLESNDMNNKSALIKHIYLQSHHINCINSKILTKETDYAKITFLKCFLIHSNNHAFCNKINCFYPTAYHNLKI